MGSDWQPSDTHNTGTHTHAHTHTHTHTHTEPGLIKDFHLVELGNDFEMLTTVKLRSPKPFHRLKFGCRSQNRRRELLATAQVTLSFIIGLAMLYEMESHRDGERRGSASNSRNHFFSHLP